MKEYKVKLYRGGTCLVDGKRSAASYAEAADVVVEELSIRGWLPDHYAPVWIRTPYHKTLHGESTTDIQLYTFVNTNPLVNISYVLSVEVTEVEVVAYSDEVEQLLVAINSLTTTIDSKQAELTAALKSLRRLTRNG